MKRPRRRTAGGDTTDAASRSDKQQVMRASGSVACDGTALALVGGDAEMEGAARVDKPEEIDTDEDDAEFDERAHWGRRRTSVKKNGTKTVKKKPMEEDKSQPKINMFCVVQPNATAATTVATSTEETLVVTTTVVETETECEVRLEETEDDGNGGSSVLEVVVQTSMHQSQSQSQTAEGISPLQVLSPSRTIAIASTTLTEDKTAPALLSPTMLSGRPKRQVVLKAEHAQLQTSEDPLFMTPPAVQPTKKSSASKATLDGEPERKVTANGSATLVPSSGRKRKLEMAGEKKKAGLLTVAAAAKAPNTTARAPSVFFLTEEQKKQVIEIEAIETFKVQLREQRERDRAFFGQRDVKNPFFQARASSISSQKIIDVDAPEVIEVLDSPEPSPAKQRKSRWVKELIEFPMVQHVLDESSQAEVESHATIEQMHFMPAKKPLNTSGEVDVVDVDDDENMEPRPAPVTLSPDQVDAEIPFDDVFWLLSSDHTYDPDDLVLASLSGELSTDELIEKTSNAYGVKEKRVRKILEALETARAKRQEKALNLSLVDKYLPVQTTGMIGNKGPLKKLSAWLSAWKNGGSNDRDRNYDDSLFAFEGDDSEEDEDGTQLYRLFVLEGDVGSGKSAAVYACAEELGYEIIEINAGQLRTGKVVVDIAGEATQSTRVLHGGGPVNEKKKKKSKAKKRRTDSEAAKPSHLSLVLFEDVDLVFDEDKGFLSTLGSIAKHSKCPIVVTCRHLPDNFPSSPPAISERLVRPTTREFMAWLSLVAHLEGIALSCVLASRLAELFACDIRRSLHFLQTYRHRIGLEASYRRASLVWKPIQQPVVTVIGSGADAPIAIADSQDDEPEAYRVPAWSRSTVRPFDLMGSNFLPRLQGSVGESIPSSEASQWTQDEKLRRVECLDDLWRSLDGLSVADEWESVVAEAHRVNAINGDEAADFFHYDAITLRTLDVRMLSLSSFFAGRKQHPDLLSLAECPLADGVDRALQAARDDCERAKKATRLAKLKTKLELPFVVKGSERVGARFCMDYLPLVSRILENSEPFQESRRRASRRNHYLGDVLLDMSAIDDIREVDACFPPLYLGDGDEIVPLSASSPPAGAGDTNSISI